MKTWVSLLRFTELGCTGWQRMFVTPVLRRQRRENPVAHRPASLACLASARLVSGPVTSAGQYSTLTASLHRHVHSYTCAHAQAHTQVW